MSNFGAHFHLKAYHFFLFLNGVCYFGGDFWSVWQVVVHELLQRSELYFKCFTKL